MHACTHQKNTHTHPESSARATGLVNKCNLQTKKKNPSMPETRLELRALYRHSVGDKRLKRKMKTRYGIHTDLKVSFTSRVCE